MYRFQHTPKEVFLIALKLVTLSVIIGLSLGIGVGLLVEYWKDITWPEISIFVGVFLWACSVAFSTYIFSIFQKKKFKQFSCIYLRDPLKDSLAVNHNQRYII